jgi:uncharacterized CHY-type Zn-finger protein
MQVYGNTIDDQTRCVHYGGPTDVVAIKFVCCGRYYPCFQCHVEAETHEEMTITEYHAVDRCPGCSAQFNDGCRLHAHLYFEQQR